MINNEFDPILIRDQEALEVIDATTEITKDAMRSKPEKIARNIGCMLLKGIMTGGGLTLFTPGYGQSRYTKER
jgi:hypothetical protein